MSIIGVLGGICSGKMLFCQLMKELYDYQIVQFDQEMDLNKTAMNIYNNWNTPTIITAITTKEQIRVLKKRNYFHLIFLDAPSVIRYRRYCEKHGQIKFEDFVKLDDKQKYDLDFLELAKNCKVYLKNNTNTIEEFTNYLKQQKTKIIRPFRPDWDVYFMKIAYTVKQRSNCMKKSVGAVLVNNNKRILSTSYNGTPKVMKNCNEGGCDVCKESKTLDLILYKCMCIHAEEGCILELGITQTRNTTLYTTLFPCVWCCKALLQAEVSRIVYCEQGNWDLSLQIIQNLIKYDQIDVEQYIY
ncbi:unnamed protein product [Paramecium pentaurelia]|uniref:dCMP deaminase n=1 Tax=Paramecium pentaurelia TaxID=43138 RepID=A0A8S1S2C8_9CILI|nr:unnamed protein product [Paramecium pentaurelia]